MGFARFSGTLELPPDRQNVFLDRDLYWDIRLFGDLGEVHLWRKNSSGEWGERFAPKQGEGWRDRQSVMWSQADPDGDWTRLSETRGVDFCVPGTFSKSKEVALKTKVKVGRDEGTGLAGIVDVMIVGIASQNGSEHPHPPGWNRLQILGRASAGQHRRSRSTAGAEPIHR